MRLIIILLFFQTGLWSQQLAIRGQVDLGMHNPSMTTLEIQLEGHKKTFRTDRQGYFELAAIPGEYIVVIKAEGFQAVYLPLILENEDLDLGRILLFPNLKQQVTEPVLTLTDADLGEDEEIANTISLLTAVRDIYLRRAAFDFGQSYFKVRGYEAMYSKVLLNGIPMNSSIDGRPEWNHWGGLNDVVRDHEFTLGAGYSAVDFGGIMGTTEIRLRPALKNSGLRITSSFSNRFYRNRLMATYNSGDSQRGISYSLSASRRLGEDGYISGTLYDAYSVYLGLEFELGEKHSLVLNGILAHNRRGSSSAITDEVFELAGRSYNPYWGWQDGVIRNSRERKIREPVILGHYFFEAKTFELMAGIAYQQGSKLKSRLGYFNAPNPSPVYYRYLPSFYINSPIGADFQGAADARRGFLKDPQLDWKRLYLVNTAPSAGGEAAYVLYDDVVQSSIFNASMRLRWKINSNWDFTGGLSYKAHKARNFREIRDLLGAEFHKDIDPFTDTQNDLFGPLQKKSGDRIGYDYGLIANRHEIYGQVLYEASHLEGFISGRWSHFEFARQGYFANERYLDSSFGKANALSFPNFGFKGGLRIKVGGQHWFQYNGFLRREAPLPTNTFINPRDNDLTIHGIGAEKIMGQELGYLFRHGGIRSRITAYYTRFQYGNEVNYFYVDSGLGSAFVQEVVTGLDRLHKGLEFGLEWDTGSGVSINLAAGFGDYTYASDPQVRINFDTSKPDRIISPEGSVDLGTANLKDKNLSGGPQLALAIGAEYRSPDYWWVGCSLNYLAENYPGLSIIKRTRSFTLDPETGEKFPGATNAKVNALLKQESLPEVYLLNLTGGRSWKFGEIYVGLFCSVQNLFDTTFKTGGYEQSRNANYGQMVRDLQRGSPSFGPKYWYGQGRTYFLNLMVQFP